MDLDELSSYLDTSQINKLSSYLDVTPPSYHDLFLISMGQTLGEIEAGKAIVDIVPDAVLYGIGLERNRLTRQVVRILPQIYQEGIYAGNALEVDTGRTVRSAIPGAPISQEQLRPGEEV